MDLFKEWIDKNIYFILMGFAFLLLAILTYWLWNQINKDR